MALTFDLSRIKDYKHICFTEDDRIMQDTENLIFATMVLGIWEISDKTAREFYLRILFEQKMFGNFKGITMPIINAHIGLKTNASKLSRAQYMSRIFKHLEERTK